MADESDSHEQGWRGHCEDPPMVGGPRVAAGVGGGRAWSACIVERAGDAGDAVPSSWPAVCGSTIPPSSARTPNPRSACRAGPWWRTDSGGSMSGGVAPASLPGGVRGGSEDRQLCPARRQRLLTHRSYARAARLLLQLLHGRRRENGAHPVVRTFTEGPLEHGRRVAYVLLSFRTRSRRRHPGEEQQPPLHARPAPADLDGVVCAKGGSLRSARSCAAPSLVWTWSATGGARSRSRPGPRPP